MNHLWRTFISAKLLWGRKEYTFSHGTEHTQSVRLKAVPQTVFKPWTYILKISEFQIEQEKSHTHTNTPIYTQSADIWLMTLWTNFLIPSTKLQGWTEEKSLNPRTPWCTPSIPTIWMRGFLSRILMHNYTVDILKECEIVGTLRIFIKSKGISSLWHYGYYTHLYSYTNTHTHTHTNTHTHTHLY
jgi:hypothetical protein